MGELFHYTKLESLDAILNTMTLKINTINKTNDPYECKAISFVASDFTVDSDRYFSGSINELTNKIVKVACFCTGTCNVFANELTEHIDCKKRPGYFYPRMWAQYSDNHNGSCIIFKKVSLEKQAIKQLSINYTIKADSINYIDILNKAHVSQMYNLLHLDEDDLDGMKEREFVVSRIEKNYQTLFLTKDIDWKDEREFRIVVFNKYEHINFEPIYLDITGMIRFIVLGERVEKDKVIEYRKKCNSIGIQLYQLKNINGDYYVKNRNQLMWED